MGGPVSEVLLPRELSDVEHARLRADLESISRGFGPSEFWDWQGAVVDTRPIGGSYVAPPGVEHERSFGVSVGPLEEVEKIPTIEKVFGWTPCQMILINLLCNRDEDHRILGEISLHLAQSFAGLVDFGGALLPPLPREMYEGGWLWQKAQWSDVAPYFGAMAALMPGRVASIEYEVLGGRTWATHVADATWMRAWLGHPSFHMIK